MTAKDIMDVCTGHTSFITIANFSKAEAHRLKPEKAGKIAIAPEKIVHIK